MYEYLHSTYIIVKAVGYESIQRCSDNQNNNVMIGGSGPPVFILNIRRW